MAHRKTQNFAPLTQNGLTDGLGRARMDWTRWMDSDGTRGFGRALPLRRDGAAAAVQQQKLAQSLPAGQMWARSASGRVVGSTSEWPRRSATRPTDGHGRRTSAGPADRAARERARPAGAAGLRVEPALGITNWRPAPQSVGPPSQTNNGPTPVAPSAWVPPARGTRQGTASGTRGTNPMRTPNSASRFTY
jgi:hypothetical protein